MKLPSSFLPAVALILLVGLAFAQTSAPAPADEEAKYTAYMLAALVDAGETGGAIDPAPLPAPDGGKTIKCPDCDGTGRVGDGRVEFTCSRCNGSGKITGAILKETDVQQCVDLDGDGVIDICIRKTPAVSASLTEISEAPAAPVQQYKTVRVRQRVRIACSTCPSGFAYSYRWVTKQVPVDGSLSTSGGAADCACGCEGQCGGDCSCPDCTCGSLVGSENGATTTSRQVFTRDAAFMQRGPVRRVISRLPIIRRFCR